MSIIYLKTGRSRTLAWTKTINGSAFVGSEGSVGEGGGGDPILNSSVGGSLKAFPKAGDPTLVFECTGTIGLHPVIGGTGIQITAKVTTPAGTFQNQTTSDVKVPPGVWNGPTISASYSISVPAEEWCMMYRFEDIYGAGVQFPNPSVSSYDPSRPYLVSYGRTFPDYSSDYPGDCPAGFADGLATTGIVFFEKAVAGSVITASSVFCGVTETQTWTVPSDLVIDYVVEDLTGGSASSNQGAISFSASSQTFTGSSLLFEGDSSLTWTDAGGTSSASNVGGVTISGSGLNTSALLNQAGTSPIQYRLNPRLLCFSDDYPASPQFDFQQAAQISSSGQFEGFVMGSASQETSFVQRRGGGSVTLGAVSPQTTPLPYRAEWCPVRGWLDSGFLTAAGDEIRDWRCLFHGRTFEAMTISQAESVSVFPAQPPQSSASSILAPAITNWEGYRSLQFEADQPGRITVTNSQGVSKSYGWTVPSPGTPALITIDLCSPDSWSGPSWGPDLPDMDSRQSRYPLDSAGDPDEISGTASTNSDGQTIDTHGACWGIFRADSLTVTNAASPSVLNLGEGNLIRRDSSDISLLGRFFPYQTEISGQPAQVMPFLLLSSDHRLTDFPAVRWTPGTKWEDVSIADIAAQVSGIPGWTAQLASSFPDSVWHTSGSPSLWLGGNGSVTDSDGTLHSWIHQPVGSAVLTVPAQALYDEVSAYPGAGDLWSGSGYDQAHPEVPLNVVKHIRGLATGLVIQPDGPPSAGGTVSLVQGAAAAGAAVSRADGWYETGLNYAKGNLSGKAVLTSSPAPSLHDDAAWQNRQFHRTTFRGSAEGASPRIAEADDGSMIASRISEGILTLVHSPSALPPLIQSSAHPEIGSITSARLCLDPHRRLWAAIVTAGHQGALYGSDDFGKTLFLQPSISMTTTLSDIRCSSQGTLLLIWFVPDSGDSGPGTLKGRLKTAGDLDFGAEFDLKDSSGTAIASDGTGFGFDSAQEPADRWVLTLAVPGDSAPSFWWSTDQGKTWVRSS